MTYNLYWTPHGPSLMAGHLGAVEPESLYFFSALRELLECPEVLEKGEYPRTMERHIAVAD